MTRLAGGFGLGAVVRGAVAGGAALLLAAGAAMAQVPAKAQGPIPLAGFSDAIHHWRNVNDPNPPTWKPEQYREIADNILLLQRDHGGWIENQDPTRILTEAEKAKYAAQKTDPTISFDNRNVFTQIEYLAEAWRRLHDARYRDAALRGIEASLKYQFRTCGGWPHTVPGHEPYNEMLTIADEVTSGMLDMLRQASTGAVPFDWLDADIRAHTVAALKAGEDCVLKLQIRQGSRLTGWAGQYDPVSLKPVMGRKFELVSITSQESVQMVRYLMSVPNPSPEMIASIEGALAWLDTVKIIGQRMDMVKLDPPVRYPYHLATEDRRLVADPAAPPIWARFYDVVDNSVVLANRDSKRVERYDQIEQERRTGYSWYGDWPAKLLATEAPKWRKRVGR